MNECIAKIVKLRIPLFKQKKFGNFVLFGISLGFVVNRLSLQTSLLCIAGELVGEESVGARFSHFVKF